MLDDHYLNLLKDKKKKVFLAGIDEAGRGPLAGPVVAACISFKFYSSCAFKYGQNFLHYLHELEVTDSKKLTGNKRQRILKKLGITNFDNLISEQIVYSKNNLFEVSVAVQEVSHVRIDEINILNAAMSSMEYAFKKIDTRNFSGIILVDGNSRPMNSSEFYDLIPIIKGDAKSYIIGLASIFAKEYRDAVMKKYAALYPEYGFEKHQGYPTMFHRKMIAQKGISPIHRRTFKGVKEFLA